MIVQGLTWKGKSLGSGTSVVWLSKKNSKIDPGGGCGLTIVIIKLVQAVGFDSSDVAPEFS